MNKAEILELALRVEALEGADREVDCLIWGQCCYRGDMEWQGHCLVVGGSVIGSIDPGKHQRNFTTNRGATGAGAIPAYTSSIDAAMGLVPEGWAVESISAWPASPEGADNKTPAQSNARLLGASMKRFGKQMIWGHSREDGRTKGEASTPANALTAACLRAIAEMGKDNG